jgi:hypothetical protein
VRRGFRLLQQGEIQEILDYFHELADPNIETRAIGSLPDDEPSDSMASRRLRQRIG